MIARPKTTEQEALDRLVSAYTSNGGKIEKIPTGKSGIPMQVKRKRIGIVINPKKARGR